MVQLRLKELAAGKAWSAFWDWTGRVDDYRGRIGVIVGLLVLIGGGVLLLLRVVGLTNTVLAVVGGVAVLVGAFVLVSFLIHISRGADIGVGDGPVQIAPPDDQVYEAVEPV